MGKLQKTQPKKAGKVQIFSAQLWDNVLELLEVIGGASYPTDPDDRNNVAIPGHVRQA